MRPRSSFGTSLREAFAKGYRSARQNLAVMLVLLAAMSLVVAIYYSWPSGASFLSWYGQWQSAGGIIRAALISGFAGSVLSEVALIYVRDRGRWTSNHVENIVFRYIVFFVGGLAVYELYVWQAIWFGNGHTWQVILPKVLVDQFIFSAFWSTPYQSITFRWQALRYDTSKLWSELDWHFVTERMLPVLVTNWMFWIPGVTLVYAMPLNLQMPMNIFAMAIWSILLAGVAKPHEPGKDIVPEPLVP